MYHSELHEGAPLKVWSADSKEYYGTGILKGYFYTWRTFNKAGWVMVPAHRILLMDGPNEGKELIGGFECFFHAAGSFHRLLQTGGITETQLKAMEQISPFVRDGFLAIGQLILPDENIAEMHEYLHSKVTTKEHPTMCLYSINFALWGLDKDFILATNVPGLDVSKKDRKSIIKDYFIDHQANEIVTSTVGWIQQEVEVPLLKSVSV